MNQKTKLLLVTTSLVLMTTGCIRGQHLITSLPEATPLAINKHLTVTKSTYLMPPAATITTESTLISELNASPMIKLGPGEYLFYEISQYDSVQNKIITWLKVKSVSSANQTPENIFDISDHKVRISLNYLIFFPQININASPFLIDISNGEKTSLPDEMKNCQSLDIFQKNKYIASCSFNGAVELYFWSPNSLALEQITNCSLEKDECLLPQLSPNGKWIAYYRIPQGGLQSTSVGLYIMPTSCLNKPEGCESQSIGPYEADGIFSWSPDSKYLAVNLDDHIRIYDVGNNSLENFTDLKNLSSYCEISWSPDNNRVIFSQDSLSEYFLTTKSVSLIQGIEPNACVINLIKISQ